MRACRWRSSPKGLWKAPWVFLIVSHTLSPFISPLCSCSRFTVKLQQKSFPFPPWGYGIIHLEHFRSWRSLCSGSSCYCCLFSLVLSLRVGSPPRRYNLAQLRIDAPLQTPATIIPAKWAGNRPSEDTFGWPASAVIKFGGSVISILLVRCRQPGTTAITPRVSSGCHGNAGQKNQNVFEAMIVSVNYKQDTCVTQNDTL